MSDRSVKGEPKPTLKPRRIFRANRVHPKTGVKGVWVVPYSKSFWNGEEKLHKDQSPSKGVVVKES